MTRGLHESVSFSCIGGAGEGDTPADCPILQACPTGVDRSASLCVVSGCDRLGSDTAEDIPPSFARGALVCGPFHSGEKRLLVSAAVVIVRPDRDLPLDSSCCWSCMRV